MIEKKRRGKKYSTKKPFRSFTLVCWLLFGELLPPFLGDEELVELEPLPDMVE